MLYGDFFQCIYHYIFFLFFYVHFVIEFLYFFPKDYADIYTIDWIVQHHCTTDFTINLVAVKYNHKKNILVNTQLTHIQHSHSN